MPKRPLITTRRHRHWHFTNTLTLIASLLLFYIITQTPHFTALTSSIKGLGYLGTFITGIFFTSTFTIAPAAVLLFELSQSLDPLTVALYAGIGGVIGDYVIYHFMRDHVYDELQPVIKEVGGRPLRRLIKTPVFAWLTPVIGAAIIASPLPDELGVSMLGLTRLKQWQFVAVTFALDFVGVFFLAVAAKA